MGVHNDQYEPYQRPALRSLFDTRRRRLHALHAAMWARHATMTDQTWASLIQSLGVYGCAWGLLADVAEVEARVHAGLSRSGE